MNYHSYRGISAIYLASAIVLGAFLAHSLEAGFSEYQLKIYKTGSFYHFVSGFSCFILLSRQHSKIPYVLNIIGGMIFSGSLYALAISQVKQLGMITPVGGSFMILAWLIYAYQMFSTKGNHSP